MNNYYIIHDDDNSRVGITPHKNSKASVFSYDIIPLPSKILNIRTYKITNGQEILLNFVLIFGSGI